MNLLALVLAVLVLAVVLVAGPVHRARRRRPWWRADVPADRDH